MSEISNKGTVVNVDRGLVVDRLTAGLENRIILRDISLYVRPGEAVALMGPNGSGKSTLAYTIMGHPHYKIFNGKIYLDGEDITDKKPEEKYRMGLFLAFQMPPETTVLSRSLYLHIAKSRGYSFSKVLETMRRIGLGEHVLDRYLNKNFSGGELKRSELLQMYISSPKYVILDEPDSGIDPDGIMIMSSILKELIDKGAGVIVITHIGRVFREIEPKRVYVLIDGRIALTGDSSLIKLIDEKGYQYIKKIAT
jgi:Fe-S cluster assembly ATP-binding protein